MPKFSKASQEKLDTCHPDLQLLFNTVIKGFDCTILCGERGWKEQNKAYDEGRSEVRYPNGKHNKSPSDAVDVAPYPVDWENIRRFYLFAGYVRRVAEELGIKVRGGHDWDGDTEINDQTFNDTPHWEIIE